MTSLARSDLPTEPDRNIDMTDVSAISHSYTDQGSIDDKPKRNRWDSQGTPDLSINDPATSIDTEDGFTTPGPKGKIPQYLDGRLSRKPSLFDLDSTRSGVFKRTRSTSTDFRTKNERTISPVGRQGRRASSRTPSELAVGRSVSKCLWCQKPAENWIPPQAKGIKAAFEQIDDLSEFSVEIIKENDVLQPSGPSRTVASGRATGSLAIPRACENHTGPLNAALLYAIHHLESTFEVPGMTMKVTWLKSNEKPSDPEGD